MDLAVFQLWKLLQGDLSIFIGSGTHGKCNQNLVGVQPSFCFEIINLQLLDWFDSGGRYQMRAVGGYCLKLLPHSAAERRKHQQIGGFTGFNRAVGQFDCGGGAAFSRLQPGPPERFCAFQWKFWPASSKALSCKPHPCFPLLWLRGSAPGNNGG